MYIIWTQKCCWSKITNRRPRTAILKLWAKNLVQTPISQFKQKTPLFYCINQPNGPKLVSQAIKKLRTLYIFSQNHHGPNGYGQPESARFRPNGLFRFWSSIYDPNWGIHEKNKIFGQNWPIGSCFPKFAFFDKFTFAVVS